MFGGFNVFGSFAGKDLEGGTKNIIAKVLGSFTQEDSEGGTNHAAQGSKTKDNSKVGDGQFETATTGAKDGEIFDRKKSDALFHTTSPSENGKVDFGTTSKGGLPININIQVEAVGEAALGLGPVTNIPHPNALLADREAMTHPEIKEWLAPGHRECPASLAPDELTACNEFFDVLAKLKCNFNQSDESYQDSV